MTSDDEPRNELPIIRQLNRSEKRHAVRRLIRQNPSWSNRRIGRTLGASHIMVGAVRREMGEQLTLC